MIDPKMTVNPFLGLWRGTVRVLVNFSMVILLCACAQTQNGGTPPSDKGTPPSDKGTPTAAKEETAPVEIEHHAPVLLKKVNLATDTPKPKDFILENRTKVDDKYPHVGVTPQGRKEQAFTKEQDEQVLKRLQGAKQNAVRQR